MAENGRKSTEIYSCRRSFEFSHSLGRELPSEPGTKRMICIARRCTDSGLSHGELLRKEDLKAATAELRSCQISAFQ